MLKLISDTWKVLKVDSTETILTVQAISKATDKNKDGILAKLPAALFLKAKNIPQDGEVIDDDGLHITQLRRDYKNFSTIYEIKDRNTDEVRSLERPLMNHLSDLHKFIGVEATLSPEYCTFLPVHKSPDSHLTTVLNLELEECFLIPEYLLIND